MFAEAALPTRRHPQYRLHLMGMHYGLIAATATQQEFLAELTRHAGEFEVGSPATPGDEMTIGERNGHTFVLDTSMMLSSEDDMVLAMSDRLGTVVCAGAETVSGTYWITAARDGVPLRCVFVQHAGMTRGMAIGDPLPTEADHPIEDVDGDGIFAALAWLGFDAAGWLTEAASDGLRWSGDRTPQRGQIGDIKRSHYERYQRPDDDNWLSRVTAVVRDEP
ncbi:hypothetical protein [Actinoplanes sp. CA-252034]|uniref:hypothetical protein n=1 Tax=Actinoplanes sp. CA-252034 TaxID=3239906 RepID=UPI003D9967A6